MKRSRSSRKNLAIRALWIVEFGLLMASVMAAAWLRFQGTEQDHLLVFASQAPPRATLIALCVTAAMTAFGLYQVHVRYQRMDFALRLLLSFAFGGVSLVVIYYMLPQMYIGRGVLAISLVIGFVAIALLRVLAMRVIHIDVLKQRVLVYGAGKNANLINTRLRRQADRQAFVLLGFVPVQGQEVVVDGAQLLRPERGLRDLVEKLHVDEILIAPDERRGGMPMDDMLICVQRGIAVTDLSTFFEREAGMVQMNIVDPSWLVFSGGFDYSLPRRLTKRFFDLVAASALLLVAWPFMLLTALAVRLDSRGPILYRQVRVGEHGRHFDIVKFRSMRADAESDGVARWASKSDDRSTRVGKFIRRTRLDELPQLFSVLSGSMSFVGPRPERPQFVDMLSKEIRYYGVRHSVKPGLTGWAQLRYPYGASVRDADEKLKFDLFYVKNHGMVFDLLILLQTVEVVLFGRGAR